MRIRDRYIVGILVMLTAGGLQAVARDDFRLKTGAGIRKEFRKRFDVTVRYKAAFDQNAATFHASYFYLNPSYRINKHLDAELEWRHATSRVWDKDRFGVALTGHRKFGSVRSSLRGKVEREVFRQSLPEIGQFPDRMQFRLEAKASVKIMRRVDVFASVEPVWRQAGPETYFKKFTLTAGAEWTFVKHHQLEGSFARQARQHSAVDTAWILEVKYLWTIPNGKKKRKPPVPAQ